MQIKDHVHHAIEQCGALILDTSYRIPHKYTGTWICAANLKFLMNWFLFRYRSVLLRDFNTGVDNLGPLTSGSLTIVITAFAFQLSSIGFMTMNAEHSPTSAHMTPLWSVDDSLRFDLIPTRSRALNSYISSTEGEAQKGFTRLQ